MLTIYGNNSRFCDGISRRNFLKIGALGLGGLALPQLLQAEAHSGIRKSQKAVIMIYLPGGPPHQDMFDLKMDAPAEIRGEFQPIKTNVPGIHICEHLPKMAAIMDKLVPIRTIVGSVGRHEGFQCYSGHEIRNGPPGGWPLLGAVVSKIQGPTSPAVPPFVGLEPTMPHKPYNFSGPGFLGPANQAFRPEGNGKADMILNGMTLDRLADRKALLAGFDRLQREVDSSGMMRGLDSFNELAFGMLTSSKLVEALDLQYEDKRTIERYGKGDPDLRGGAGRMPGNFLIARRLVEAGVRCVTVAFGHWDYHSNNFSSAREDLPMLDRGVSALVEDLHERGLDKDVSVVVWGEFGRTPTINKDAGRDHWERLSCALLACGGMKTGQVIGSTDRLGGEVVDRPVHFGEVFATLYHNLGLDPNKTTVTDLAGRPHYLVEEGYQPIKELI